MSGQSRPGNQEIRAIEVRGRACSSCYGNKLETGPAHSVGNKIGAESRSRGQGSRRGDRGRASKPLLAARNDGREHKMAAAATMEYLWRSCTSGGENSPKPGL
jgi:hypothetical protein